MEMRLFRAIFTTTIAAAVLVTPLLAPVTAVASSVSVATNASDPGSLAAPEPPAARPKVAEVGQEKSASWEKWAVWGQLHAGDCQQDNGTLVIRSDGTGDWSATTLTYHTHSGDVWHSSFDFYTTAGFHLFGVGQFNSPRMDDGNPPPRYNWGAHFTFDPAEFNGVDIFSTIQHYSC